MSTRTSRSRSLVVLAAFAFACLAAPRLAMAQGSPSSLQKLVAPIALYPDALVAQILPASTKPIQVVEAARSVADGGRPSQATASQWDPSVQALLSFPTVLKMMNDKLDWMTQLGQAVTADQASVMAAIQAVRRQAQAAGNLKSNDKQTIQVSGSGDTTMIVIEPANPQYIYVPQYNPVAVLAPAPYYGAWASPLMTFGVGFAAGAATAYACDWGHGYGSGSVTVNNNYHYSYSNNYDAYHPYDTSGSSSHYNPYTGGSTHYNENTGTTAHYNPTTGTYSAYNSKTGHYGTYDPSTGQYNKDGQTGTYHPPSSTDAYHPPSSESQSAHSEGSHYGSSEGSGGDAFHGMNGGGWGARDASNRGSDSWGNRGGGGSDRFGGGGFGGGGFRGGGFGGGGFRGRR